MPQGDLQKQIKKKPFEFKLSNVQEQAQPVYKNWLEERRLDMVASKVDVGALTLENERITRELSEELSKADGTKVEEGFARREKSRLETQMMRNQAMLLYLDTKDKSKRPEETDSPEMKQVKNRLLLLDGALRSPVDPAMDLEEQAGEVLRCYDNAIAACMDYGESKHSVFPMSKARKKKVAAMLEALAQEKARFIQALAEVKEAPQERKEQIGCALDLLEGKHIDEGVGTEGEHYLARKKRELMSLRKANGDRDGGDMQRIKDGFEAMARALAKQIPQEDEDFEKERDTIKGHYKRLRENCEAYIGSHGGKHKEEGQRRLDAVKRMLERSKLEWKYFREIADRRHHQAVPGSWADVYAEAGQQVDECLGARKRMDRILAHGDMRDMVVIWSAIEELREEDPVKYANLDSDLQVPWLQKNLSKKQVVEMFRLRKELSKEIKEAFQKLYQECQTVPAEFLKEGADPQSERLRGAYVRLLLQRHPAYRMLKGINNLASCIALKMNAESIFAKEVKKTGVREALVQVEQELRSQGYVDVQLEAEARDIFSGKDITDLKQDMVRQYQQLVDRETRSMGKEIMLDLFSGSYISYSSGEAQQAGWDLSRFEERKMGRSNVKFQGILMANVQEAGLFREGMRERNQELLYPGGISREEAKRIQPQQGAQESMFTALLQAMIELDPEYMKTLVRGQIGGMAVVQLCDEKGDLVSLTMNQVMVGGGSDVLWVNLLEKAAAMLYRKDNPDDSAEPLSFHARDEKVEEAEKNGTIRYGLSDFYGPVTDEKLQLAARILFGNNVALYRKALLLARRIRKEGIDVVHAQVAEERRRKLREREESDLAYRGEVDQAVQQLEEKRAQYAEDVQKAKEHVEDLQRVFAAEHSEEFAVQTAYSFHDVQARIERCDRELSHLQREQEIGLWPGLDVEENSRYIEKADAVRAEQRNLFDALQQQYQTVREQEKSRSEA